MENSDNKSLFISGKESIKIYDNKFLESITTTHHVVPFVIFVPVTLFFLYQTVLFSMAHNYNPWLNFPLIIGGVLLWTFIEYTGHRYVFTVIQSLKLEKNYFILFMVLTMIIQMTQEDWLFRPLYLFLVDYCFIGGYTAYLDHTCLRHFLCPWCFPI